MFLKREHSPEIRVPKSRNRRFRDFAEITLSRDFSFLFFFWIFFFLKRKVSTFRALNAREFFLFFQGNFAFRCAKYFRALGCQVRRAWVGKAFKKRKSDFSSRNSRSEKLVLCRLQEKIFADENFFGLGRSHGTLSSPMSTWWPVSSTMAAHCRPVLVTMSTLSVKVTSAGWQVVVHCRRHLVTRSSTGPGRSSGPDTIDDFSGLVPSAPGLPSARSTSVGKSRRNCSQ